MQDLPSRLKRVLELVYAVDGVSGAKVWQWDGKIAIGVRPALPQATTDLVDRVRAAVEALREPGETWEFGVLEDEP